MPEHPREERCQLRPLPRRERREQLVLDVVGHRVQGGQAGPPRAGEQVRLTGRGRARHQRVRARLDEVTAAIFDFPADDLAVAGRVLGVVAERANAVLAAG